MSQPLGEPPRLPTATEQQVRARDMFEFQRAATDKLRAEVTCTPTGALANNHVSADLVAITPLRPAASGLITTRCWKLRTLPAQIAVLSTEGIAYRFAADARYRRILRRAMDGRRKRSLGLHPGHRPARPRRQGLGNLYDPRNHLAHFRLPDIDESLVHRFT